MFLRFILPDKHLSAESKDVVKLGMGLIGTMTALVLGLLIASAKSSFDAQRNGLVQLSANIILLDRALARYGPEAKEVRDMVKASVEDMAQRTWPNEFSQGQNTEKSRTEGRYEGVFERIQGLTPKNEAQRTLQAQALKTGTDIAQTRWLLFAQEAGSIPTPFLVVMVCWLTLIFASFSLFAPPNATALLTLLVCALAISSAILLILELDRPFDGLMQVSSAPIRNALTQLGH
jgi:hypothetical protein